MINFVINEPESIPRYNKDYLACILIVEEVISILKPSSEFYYSFNFVENATLPPHIEINHIKDYKSTFDETIVSETNKRLKDIFTELDQKSHNIDEIANKAKTRIKENLKSRGLIGRAFNLEQSLNALTPFSVENNTTEKFILGNEHKLMVLLMAIYSRCIHLEVIQGVLALLEKEEFSV